VKIERDDGKISSKILLSQGFILSLILAVSYGILIFVLIYYKLINYFVFANIFVLTLIIYQIYLLIKPISKKTLLNSLYYKIKGFFVRLKEDVERVNKIVLRLFNGLKERAHHKENGKLGSSLPSHHIKENIITKRKNVLKRNGRLFYLILGLLFFSISLYLGLTLEKDVFIYGYLIPILLILFTIFALILLGVLLVLVFRFTFWIIKKIFYKTNK